MPATVPLYIDKYPTGKLKTLDIICLVYLTNSRYIGYSYPKYICIIYLLTWKKYLQMLEGQCCWYFVENTPWYRTYRCSLLPIYCGVAFDQSSNNRSFWVCNMQELIFWSTVSGIMLVISPKNMFCFSVPNLVPHWTIDIHYCFSFR